MLQSVYWLRLDRLRVSEALHLACPLEPTEVVRAEETIHRHAVVSGRLWIACQDGVGRLAGIQERDLREVPDVALARVAGPPDREVDPWCAGPVGRVVDVNVAGFSRATHL